MDNKETEMTGPTTYNEIRWAAMAYRGRYDDDRYAHILNSGLRESLLEGDAASVHNLMQWLNHLGSRIPYDMAEDLASAIKQVAQKIRGLANVELTSPDWDLPAERSAIKDAFERLESVRGSTVAAKTLAVLNPKLFVMWDSAIWYACHCDETLRGSTIGTTYTSFLVRMQRAAKSILQDASCCPERRIIDPAQHLSSALGLRTVFPLAKFIDEYNWLTIARGLRYPEALVGEERRG